MVVCVTGTLLGPGFRSTGIGETTYAYGLASCWWPAATSRPKTIIGVIDDTSERSRLGGCGACRRCRFQAPTVSARQGRMTDHLAGATMPTFVKAPIGNSANKTTPTEKRSRVRQVAGLAASG